MKLFIGNLSYETTDQELRDALAEYEPILEIRRPCDRESGQPRGFAFVTFVTREVGERALLELKQVKVGGRLLRIDEAVEREAPRFPGERPPRPSMDLGKSPRVDDRPLGPDGKKVRYKGI